MKNSLLRAELFHVDRWTYRQTCRSYFANAPKNYQSLQLRPPASQLKLKVDTSRIQDYSFTATPNC